MKTGADNRKQMIMAGVLGVFALGACIYLYEELFSGGSTPDPTPAPAVTSVPAGKTAGPVAKTLGTTSAGLDPTLHMDAMLVSESVVYTGSGRNIFSAYSAPVVIPPPIATARNNTPPPVPVVLPPVVIPPPPIDLKFFGVEIGANGVQEAFLLHEDSVYLASAGEIVLRRYRVISVNAKAIEVEDMQNNNRQTLPLLAN
jgi:hypothetical protein